MDNDKILKELKTIKWLISLTTLFLFIISSIFLIAFLRKSDKNLQPKQITTAYEDKAQELLNQGRYLDVISLTRTYEQENPGDANAYWYRGIAFYRLNKWLEAIEAFKKVEELSPDWGHDYTEPYLIRAREKLADSNK